MIINRIINPLKYIKINNTDNNDDDNNNDSGGEL